MRSVPGMPLALVGFYSAEILAVCIFLRGMPWPSARWSGSPTHHRYPCLITNRLTIQNTVPVYISADAFLQDLSAYDLPVSMVEAMRLLGVYVDGRGGPQVSFDHALHAAVCAWHRHRRWLCSAQLPLRQRFALWSQHVAAAFLWCAGGLLLQDGHIQALHRFDLRCHRSMLRRARTLAMTWSAWFRDTAARIRSHRRHWHMR
eukprot:5826882-Amphidinium_carterae.1